MSEGIILVLVILLFFGLMYLFAFVTTGYKERQLERRHIKKLERVKLKEEQLRIDHKERLNAIDLKYEVSNKRSEEIKRELELLQAKNYKREK